jgi:hypothetical protein
VQEKVFAMPVAPRQLEVLGDAQAWEAGCDNRGIGLAFDLYIGIKPPERVEDRKTWMYEYGLSKAKLKVKRK